MMTVPASPPPSVIPSLVIRFRVRVGGAARYSILQPIKSDCRSSCVILGHAFALAEDDGHALALSTIWS